MTTIVCGRDRYVSCMLDIGKLFNTLRPGQQFVIADIRKITVFDTMVCKRPDVPLQVELLALTIQLRTSQPSILAVLHGWEY